ncbi:CHAT domain-containing protein [Aquiflexum balticum DSM 16537]|uniref:CHAT domain-containing protein n=1 Tax=Aquiflexum balticum DSM 16537 TaxID=758820 RepID=A0A1W2H9B6_9BACT|nr:CHAT domain-containing tetratricopeptide repeat protein [Aquiflexum balticum]SMD45465.1 CHAT domain-containing protein [Aquiflexum balticum DSM 16537]
MHLIWLIFFLGIFFQDSSAVSQDVLIKKYEQAIALYESDEPTDYTDSLTLAYLKEIIDNPSSSELETKVLVDIYEKLGSLNLIGGKLQEAIKYYKNALEFRGGSSSQDSIFFGSNLFLGETYYLLSKADSSIIFLEEAERLLAAKESKNESSRLFNSLGVIYFASGNYNQAINYFSKAKNLTIGEESFENLDPYYQYALYSFLNNIGSSLVNLQKADSALLIYKDLLRFGINQDRTNSQIAGIFLEKKLPDSALFYLNKISPEFQNRYDYKNQQAEVYFQKKKYVEAKNILIGFLKSNEALNNGASDFRLGSTHNLLGEITFESGDFEGSAGYFHQAIIQIDGLFDDKSIFSNPLDYTFGFESFSLFKALTGKAKAFAVLANKENNPSYRETAVATYQSAFEIANNVSNYYDNDDARVFFGDFVLESYQEAVGFLVDQYQNSNDREFLEKAFEWAENSKATGLDYSLNERQVKLDSDIPKDLIQIERDLKFSISQIQQKILQESDDKARQELQNLLIDERLELSRLQDRFNDFPQYLSGKMQSRNFNIPYFQKEILNDKTFLTAFFEAKNNLYLFSMDKENLSFFDLGEKKDFKEKIEAYKNSVRNYKVGERYKKGDLGREMFDKLFGPVDKQLLKFEGLLIIPHGNLSDLPFGSLETKSGRFLIESHEITRQFSLKFVEFQKIPNSKNLNKLGFAPFENHNWDNNGLYFSDLPYSSDEVGSIEGIIYVNDFATKSRFLEDADRANVIHLATHAIPDPSVPDQAFIVFYPGDVESRLFTHEIYNLNLDNTSLVYLSACETNTGSLSESEGILGISRAFAFAGCPNIITTLWKAEDKATAYISGRFYHYLKKGETYTSALRLSKLDLLNDPKMSQYHHPAFWAHIILTGNITESEGVHYTSFIWIAIVVLVFSLMILLFKKKKTLFNI